MSADILRRAASLMRERAEAAVHDSDGARVWHSATPSSVSAGPWEIAASLAQPDAEHIASWHPAVALAVADWLDAIAPIVEAELENHWGHGIASTGALAVARAYLRETA